jgi:N-methylhydantoinase A
VRHPLDPASVAAAAETLRAEAVDSVAVCLLHAYRNPMHERAVADLLAEMLPGMPVSLSHAVAPVMGEYERGSTTVVNAYIAPRVVPYLRALEARLAAEGLGPRLLLVQSNGGVATVDAVAERPVQLLLSGPAAGVGALRYFGRDCGAENLISIEVGGTSCDVTLSRGGAVGMTDLLDIDGQTVVTPAVEIHTVGAGGGTIARLDRAGMLVAGPQGAGARPGPACYGLGGERPTVTDCQLVLGRLKPGPYAGGAISLDPARAEAALRAQVAGPLGIGLDEAASGVLRLVEQTIQHAVERVSIERGYDPRDFILVAAGGAGPLHGPATARALGVRRVYVPRLAGVFCALGMCNADIRQDHVRSWLAELDDPADPALGALGDAVATMRRQAEEALARQGFTGAAAATEISVDLRYPGQQWPITVHCPELMPSAIRAAFERDYRQLYGYVQEGARIETVNLRVAGIGRVPPLALRPPPGAEAPPRAVATRSVWIGPETGRADTAVYDGAALRPGHRVAGPAIVEEATTTLIVGADDTLTVTGAGNYLIEIGGTEP